MIIPLTITQINFPEFFRKVKDVENRDIGRLVDLENVKGHPVSYIVALKVFAKEFATNTKFYKFLHFAFLTDVEGLDYFDLEVLASRSNHLSIIMGNLNQWRQAVIEGCSKEMRPDVLETFNGVYRFFELAGLKDIWYDYRKEDLGQGTFTLWKP